MGHSVASTELAPATKRAGAMPRGSLPNDMSCLPELHAMSVTCAPSCSVSPHISSGLKISPSASIKPVSRAKGAALGMSVVMQNPGLAGCFAELRLCYPAYGADEVATCPQLRRHSAA